MLDKKLDEYVTRVENDAYELGISVGKNKERERIIKLIEDYLNDKLIDVDGNTIWSSYQDWSGLREAIKLINGENE